MNKETDSTSLCYQLLKQQLKCCKHKLIHALRLDNAEISKIILVSQSEKKLRGRFSIYKMELDIPIDEASFFCAWLSKDYPEIGITYFSSKLTAEENRSSETAVDVLNKLNFAFERGTNYGTESQ